MSHDSSWARERREPAFLRFLPLGLATIMFVSVGCRPNRLTPEDFARNHDENSQAEPSRPATSETADQEDRFREAAARGDLDEIRQLVKAGVPVTCAGPEGRTALHMASFDGHDAAVAWLIEQDLDVNARDAFGRTPLMYAATGANAKTVTVLLKAGAKPDLVDNEEHFSAIMFAAAEGQTEVVRTLLTHGANATLTDIDGESSLDFARANGHADVVELLQESN